MFLSNGLVAKFRRFQNGLALKHPACGQCIYPGSRDELADKAASAWVRRDAQTRRASPSFGNKFDGSSEHAHGLDPYMKEGHFARVGVAPVGLEPVQSSTAAVSDECKSSVPGCRSPGRWCTRHRRRTRGPSCCGCAARPETVGVCKSPPAFFGAAGFRARKRLVLSSADSDVHAL